MSQEAPRTADFFFMPAYTPGAADPCAAGAPCVIVLVGPKWTRFLRRRIGLAQEPFFSRPALQHEPDLFPSGQPFAWIYRKPLEVLLEERRWLGADQLQRLQAALDAAMAAADPNAGQEQARAA